MADYASRRYALLNRWDPTHLDRVDRMLGVSKGDRVLEVGSGQGHLTKRLAMRGVDILGIDANPEAAAVAPSDRVVHMMIEDLDFADAEFDSIISIHAIEHFTHLPEALSEMARVLKPGGRALHVYPAEPIKGLYAIPTSIILHGTPFRAREIHCNKLWPAKLESMMAPFGMLETHHEFSMFKMPQFSSVFEKSL